MLKTHNYGTAILEHVMSTACNIKIVSWLSVPNMIPYTLKGPRPKSTTKSSILLTVCVQKRAGSETERQYARGTTVWDESQSIWTRKTDTRHMGKGVYCIYPTRKGRQLDTGANNQDRANRKWSIHPVQEWKALLQLFFTPNRKEFAELLEKYGSNGSTGSTRNSPIQQGRQILTPSDIFGCLHT